MGVGPMVVENGLDIVHMNRTSYMEGGHRGAET